MATSTASASSLNDPDPAGHESSGTDYWQTTESTLTPQIQKTETKVVGLCNLSAMVGLIVERRNSKDLDTNK